VAVVEAFGSGVLDLPDFYFTGDDYRYRFETEAKRRFLDLLRDRFNAGIRYDGRVLKWDTVIERKVLELSRFLIGRSVRLCFCEPSPSLCGIDDRELRKRVLSLAHSEARRLGIGKSTLFSLRRTATSERSFKVYQKVRRRLDPSLPAPRLA
jgi:hypothetical protein